MLTKRIIPCLDVKDGRVVKGIKFLNLKDAGDPAETAAAYDAQGADEVVFLDITASADSRDTQLSWVRDVASTLFIPFTVGGGIRTTDDFKAILREGADKIAVNSAALMNPDLISEAAMKFGSQCVVLAMDAKRIEGTDRPRNTSFAAMSSRFRTKALSFLHRTILICSAWLYRYAFLIRLRASSKSSARFSTGKISILTPIS